MGECGMLYKSVFSAQNRKELYEDQAVYNFFLSPTVNFIYLFFYVGFKYNIFYCVLVLLYMNK